MKSVNTNSWNQNKRPAGIPWMAADFFDFRAHCIIQCYKRSLQTWLDAIRTPSELSSLGVLAATWESFTGYTFAILESVPSRLLAQWACAKYHMMLVPRRFCYILSDWFRPFDQFTFWTRRLWENVPFIPLLLHPCYSPLYFFIFLSLQFSNIHFFITFFFFFFFSPELWGIKK